MTDKRTEALHTLTCMQAAVRYLLDENAALDAQLDKALAENAALTAHIATADRTVWKLRDDNAALDAHLNDVTLKLQIEHAVTADLGKKVTALESMQSRFKGLEADMRGTMTTLEDERNTVAHLRAQVQTKDDAITLLEEDNAALDARVGELLKAPIMPDHHPVGSTVYCRTPSGVRKSRIDGVRITVGESESQLHYTIDGGMWPVTQVFLTADEAFASTTH